MQVLEPQTICVNVLVDAMEGLLRRILREDIALVISLGDGADCINADRAQIEQVLMNLAVNARDAMPTGGTLSIRTDVAEADTTVLPAHTGAVHVPHVRLRVTDTGDGMTPDVLAHLFEPFFTTKERGQGTGLGLATVYGIVEQSGGRISVESAPGHGTTFTLTFPVVLETPASIALDEHVEQIPGGGETVLVVEDQEEVRRAATEALQRHGYRVLEATDGTSALALLDAEPGPVHLLLTDVVMPHMSGPELADRARREHGVPRVLFMSGYTGDAVSRHGVLDARIDLLPKPFSPLQLLTRVRHSLDRRGEQSGRVNAAEG
jgi:CheY-like chemotaxis protein